MDGHIMSFFSYCMCVVVPVCLICAIVAFIVTVEFNLYISLHPYTKLEKYVCVCVIFYNVYTRV